MRGRRDALHIAPEGSSGILIKSGRRHAASLGECQRNVLLSDAASLIIALREKEIFPMRQAVIVSTARTPIGRAFRGAFNETQPQALAGHAIAEAVRRAGVAPAEIDDVIIGAAIQQGAQGFNVARQSALRAEAARQRARRCRSTGNVRRG